MAHSLSAKKRVRQNVKARALNKTRASGLKSQLRKTNVDITASDPKVAATALAEAASALDRAATQRTLHPNAAARRKSKLALKLNAAKKAAGAAK